MDEQEKIYVPQQFTGAEMAKVGVRIVEELKVTLECVKCKTKWMSPLLYGGRFAANYWVCINGCNAQEETE